MRQMTTNISDAEYTVFEDGRVFGKEGKEIKQRLNSDGYAVFTAGKKGSRKSMRTHRIVGELFVPNPNGLEELDHLDNNRMNPSASNLEWVTHQENIARAYARGSHIGRATGEKNSRARLTEELVRVLRNEYESGTTIKELADKYQLPWNTVGNAVKGITWSHVEL